VDRLGLGGASDNAVWDYAKQNNFVLVSKDSDFYDKSTLFGFPPKVIWIKCGNCTNRHIELLIRNKHSPLIAFGNDQENGYLILL